VLTKMKETAGVRGKTSECEICNSCNKLLSFKQQLFEEGQ